MQGILKTNGVDLFIILAHRLLLLAILTAMLKLPISIILVGK